MPDGDFFTSESIDTSLWSWKVVKPQKVLKA
jgi:hypothetical protein